MLQHFQAHAHEIQGQFYTQMIYLNLFEIRSLHNIYILIFEMNIWHSSHLFGKKRPNIDSGVEHVRRTSQR